MHEVIQQATYGDLDAIKKIADANKDTLGFVMRPALIMAIERHWLLIAEKDSQIVGFINYRHCRNEQTTIYELCVSQEHRGQGIGRLLIDALRQEAQEQGKATIQLKAVVGIAANGFYEHYGFTLVGVETGRKRPLNVWRLSLT